MIESLPEEIIQNILSRLPVKCLLKCTSVCKSWRSKIKNPSFIRAHLSRTVNLYNQYNTHLLLLHGVSGSPGYGSRVCELYSLLYDNHDFDEYCKLEFPVAHKEKLCNSFFRAVSICNGLVCLADDIFSYGYSFIIWNPSIRKSVELPEPSITFSTHGGYEATIGFGYDAINNDYKVVRLVSLYDRERSTKVEVYSLATGSWTKPTYDAPLCRIEGKALQAFVNGALHWPVLHWTDRGHLYFILAFDLNSDLFREILMPESFIWNGALRFRLSVSGDHKSLAMFTMNHTREDYLLDIWVMKEYCIKESWTKLITLGPQGPERRLPKPLCFRKSSEVLLILDEGDKYVFVNDMLIPNTSRREFLSLDLVSKQFKNLGICGHQNCSVYSYEESLGLLDKTNAVSY